MELVKYNSNEESNSGLAIKTVSISNLVSALQKNEIVETSAFVGSAASDFEVALFVKKLEELTDMSKAQIADIGNTVRLEKWTKQRLDYAIDKVRHFEYTRVASGKILNLDKTITFGRTELALRRNLKFNITQNEIVMIKLKRTYEENGETKHDFVRAFAYKEEAEEIMPDKIVGRWNDTEHCFEYCGTIENHETEIRKLAFKESLFKFCNTPPYNGEYDVAIVKQFFEFWSQTIPPGDMMKFERFMKFDAEIALKDYNKKTKQQNQN